MQVNFAPSEASMANREYGDCPAWYEHEDLAELKALLREAFTKTQCSQFDLPICKAKVLLGHYEADWRSLGEVVAEVCGSPAEDIVNPTDAAAHTLRKLSAELATVKAERDAARREHVMPRYWEAERELSAAKLERDRAMSDLASARDALAMIRALAGDQKRMHVNNRDGIDCTGRLDAIEHECWNILDRAQPAPATASGDSAESKRVVMIFNVVSSLQQPVTLADLERLREDVEWIAWWVVWEACELAHGSRAALPCVPPDALNDLAAALSEGGETDGR